LRQFTVDEFLAGDSSQKLYFISGYTARCEAIKQIIVITGWKQQQVVKGNFDNRPNRRGDFSLGVFNVTLGCFHKILIVLPRLWLLLQPANWNAGDSMRGKFQRQAN